MDTNRFAVHALDVWGNEEDGYEVNDTYPACAVIEIPDNITPINEGDTEADFIADLLVKAGIIFEGTPTGYYSMDACSDDCAIYLNIATSGKPEFFINRVDC